MSVINILGDEEVYGELLPNWTLVKLVRPAASLHLKDYTQEVTSLDNYLQMLWGNWGLTYSNDPSFVFSNNPLPKYSKAKNYYNVLTAYNAELGGPIHQCYNLYTACLEAGYREKQGSMATFIMDKMYYKLKACNWIPEKIYPCVSSARLLETKRIK
jgi:hypothetical protein